MRKSIHNSDDKVSAAGTAGRADIPARGKERSTAAVSCHAADGAYGYRRLHCKQEVPARAERVHARRRAPDGAAEAADAAVEAAYC